MKRVVFAMCSVVAFAACSKSDDKQPTRTPPENKPHVSTLCPEKIEGFYINADEKAPGHHRYFSIHSNDQGILVINISPSAERDVSTDTVVNGEKKTFENGSWNKASCADQAIVVEKSSVEGKLTTTEMRFEGEGAKVKMTTAANEVLVMSYKKSPLPPKQKLTPEPTPGGPGSGDGQGANEIDVYGCPAILGKFALTDLAPEMSAKYLKFTRNEKGLLTIAATSFTAEYPVIEMDNVPRGNGTGGMVTGSCEKGVISIVGEAPNGDTDILEMKKESDKFLNVKKIENGKAVKTYKYEKIR